MLRQMAKNTESLAFYSVPVHLRWCKITDSFPSFSSQYVSVGVSHIMDTVCIVYLKISIMPGVYGHFT